MIFCISSNVLTQFLRRVRLSILGPSHKASQGLICVSKKKPSMPTAAAALA